MIRFLGLFSVFLVLSAIGCTDEGSSAQAPALAPVYGGKILVAQGPNPIGSTGPVTDKVALVLGVSNQGSEPMELHSLIGKIISNDASLTVTITLEVESTSGGKTRLDQLAQTVPVDRLRPFPVGVVVPAGETVVLRVLMTSPNASTGDTLQFLGMELDSTGGTAAPPASAGQPGTWSGMSFLAG